MPARNCCDNSRSLGTFRSIYSMRFREALVAAEAINAVATVPERTSISLATAMKQRVRCHAVDNKGSQPRPVPELVRGDRQRGLPTSPPRGFRQPGDGLNAITMEWNLIFLT